MRFLRRTAIDRPLATGIAITVVTVALVGTVLLTSTTLGCAPADKVGLKLPRCANGSPVAARLTPSPYLMPTPSPTEYPNQSPPPAPNPNPPSNPYPNPPSGPEPPNGYPATGAYPPFYPPASYPNQSMPYSVSCRLPIYAGQSGSGGFIVFPGGSFIADPTSAVLAPEPSPGSPSPSTQPMGPGGPQNFYGLTYDHKYSRWLAVPYSWVTPDQTRYAFPTADGVYVDDIASGSLTELGQGHPWSIVGVQSAGVYAVLPNAAGLWLLPFSGMPSELLTTGYWQAVSATAAYGTATSAVPQGASNTILRYDLKAATVQNWFTRDGAQSSVTGFDAVGNPVITVYYYGQYQGSELWIVTAADQGTPILGSQAEGVSANGNVIGDANGLWMAIYYQYAYAGNQQEMALYVPGKGLFGMSNISGQLAGPCV
jgi:hypothetical protein